ncbi:MAG: hypothetical protein PHS14_18070 [Elusimicrobia bacterium]|nr:hypothetical protein [Elusimicrobiota bacterium]
MPKKQKITLKPRPEAGGTLGGKMPPGYPPTGSSGLPPNTAMAAPGGALPKPGTRDKSNRLVPGAQGPTAFMVGPEIDENWDLTSELGATGLRQWSGIVREELLPKLTGMQGILTYREMSDNDPIIGASLTTIDLKARNTDWRIDPAGDSPEDLRAAAYLESIRHDMAQTWPDHISEAMTMLAYGWSMFEIVYKVRKGPNKDPHLDSRFNDGLIGVRKLAIRGQDTLFRWQFDGTGGIQALIQRPPPDYYERVIPIQKALLYRTAMRKNNPEGRSILRNSYSSWFYKKRIEQFQAVGIERDVAGIPCIGVPAQLFASTNAKDAAAMAKWNRVAVNLRNDEQAGIVYPMQYDQQGKPMFEIKLLTTGGRKQFDTHAILEYYDQRIAMSLMTDFLFLGMAGARQARTGSYNLGEAKMSSFSNAMGAYLDVIENVLNRYLVPRLFELNNWRVDHLPQFKHEPVENPNLQEMGAFLTALANAGMPMFPDEDLEAYLRRLASLPVAPAPETSEEADEAADEETKPEFESDETGDEPAVVQAHPRALKPAGPSAGQPGGNGKNGQQHSRAMPAGRFGR